MALHNYQHLTTLSRYLCRLIKTDYCIKVSILESNE